LIINGLNFFKMLIIKVIIMPVLFVISYIVDNCFLGV